ncbi:MAG: hypothetical protein VKL39_20695 [Leptolyngbyaceae bacterium]|nr:hypothetical protein [Leptolyngbyaceae bacterium]
MFLLFPSSDDEIRLLADFNRCLLGDGEYDDTILYGRSGTGGAIAHSRESMVTHRSAIHLPVMHRFSFLLSTLQRTEPMDMLPLKSSAALLSTALLLGALSPSPAGAQDTTTINTGLTENEGYIQGCRETNASVDVFRNSDLAPIANRIRTLTEGTEVRLTGVLAPGRAQVYLPEGELSDVQPVGWVNAANLTGCDDDTDDPTDDPTADACFRADVALNVRSQPSINSTLLTTYAAGNVIYATTDPPTQVTSPNTAPNYGRIWTAVVFDSTRGWISRTGRYGTNSNVTPIPCP